MTQARNLSRLLNKDITTYMYTATAGQTAFTGSDNNSQTLTFDNQSIMVTYNGVMLEKGSEFTVATNTVTLLAGAEVNAEVNVIVFNNASLGGYVKSTGGDIDGGVNITSGNFLVGQTAISDYPTTIGSSLRASGFSTHTADNNAPLLLNRLTSDGDIVLFRKNNTNVGSIGSRAGVASYIVLDPRNSGGNGGVGLTGVGAVIRPTNYTGGQTDNHVSLGSSTARFKDAYLSDGIYLGGTGSANKLSDVETGTWTPALSRTGSNYSYNGYQYGTYEKIGNLVVASFTLNLQSISTQGSSYNQLSGLPFTPSAYNANLQFVGSLGIRTVLSSASSFYWAGAIFFLDSSSNPIQTNFTTGYMSGFITYKTAS